MENSMNTANYNRFIGFMAKLESAATTAKERNVINSARGMFAKCAQLESEQRRASTANAGTFTVNVPNGTSPEYTSGMREHGGSNIKPMTPEEKEAFNADVTARNKQWKKQLGSMKRRVKTAESTLEQYAEIAPGELDAWVENTLRPTIEEYLDTEEGGLVWADENKKTVKKERGAGGFVTPAMKRAKYEDDKKAYIEQLKAKKAKEEEAKKAKEAEAKAKADDDALMKETAEKAAKAEAEKKKKAEEEANPKKKGLFKRVFGAAKDAILGKEAKLGGGLDESIATSDLRACFESVFGNSDHLSDEAIRAICYNAVDRKCR